MPSLEAEMLEFIPPGLDHHAQSCPLAPRAILLNPGNHQLFGWDELWGIRFYADDRVAPKRFRIDCDGSAYGIEAEIADAIAAPEPLVVPPRYRSGPRRRSLRLMARGGAAPRSIALTYDDGPNPDGTRRVLDLLAWRGVQATFFVLRGKSAERHPEVVREAIAAGHSVQPHCSGTSRTGSAGATRSPPTSTR